MVVRGVSELAKSHFPGSGDPALQIIEVPSGPAGEILTEGFFDLELNLARPCKIDYLVLQEGEEERTAEREDIFEKWGWQETSG